MKKLLFLLALLSSSYLFAQEQTEVTKKDIQLSNPPTKSHLVLRNISGDITVEGYSGNTIQLEARKVISGESNASIERGMEEVSVEVIDKGDVIGIFMTSPCSKDPALISREDLLNGWNEWNNNCRWNPDYDYNVYFTLKVPSGMHVKVGTINNGDVKVSNVSGKLDASNVNGSISLDQISGPTEATTVNGDVTLKFSQVPKDDCKFYTLNGDINAYFPKNLNAFVGFKTFQGDFFTDLDDIEITGPQVTQSSAQKGEGISFKLDSSRRMKAGNGGIHIMFETFNGDAYLRGK
jgi:DUF4097 and DUF4098 domain-containing protein YvlB